MVKRADKGMPYPYLHDESQEVATAWGAKRTILSDEWRRSRCLPRTLRQLSTQAMEATTEI